MNYWNGKEWIPVGGRPPLRVGYEKGDTVHVRGVVEEIGRTCALVKFDFFGTSLWARDKDIVAHEPALFKIGDKVQSKDGRVGTIRYIEDDWAVVVEPFGGRTFRYLIDLQRAP